VFVPGSGSIGEPSADDRGAADPRGSGRTDPVERVLVLHPGALGDVLQAVPALRALGARGRVTVAGQGRLAAFLRDTGVVTEALVFDTLGLEALFTPDLPGPAALRSFTAVVSWFGAGDDTFTRRLRAVAERTVIASPTGAGDATAIGPPEPAEERVPVPVWRHLAGTVTSLTRAPGPADLAPLAIPPGWRVEARQALAAAGVQGARCLLVIHPGAGGAWKRWPAERFARVVERLAETGVQPLIHQGPADRDAADDLRRLIGPRAARLVEPELPVLAAVLADAHAYLGGDSGVSHLAAAVGAPAVILYPRTTRERWEPWSPSALALTMADDPGQPAEVARRLTAPLAGRTGASTPSSRAAP
jgi:ADP-heptose:LPS heptosyltransferase